jgi:hypothetical protein
VKVDASESQQRGKHFDGKAGVGAGVQALYAHTLQLAVDCLNSMPIATQTAPLVKGVGLHVGFVPGHEVYTIALGGGSQCSLDLGTDVPFVSVHSGSFGQAKCQLIDGSEVMPGSGQQLKAHWYSLWGTDQMQSPPKEEPFLSSTLAEEVPSVRVSSIDLAASEGSHSLAHRHGHTVYDESLTLRKQLSQKMHHVLQPLGKCVQPATEAGSANRFGDVAQSFHHEQRSFMVIVEVHRCYYRYCEHFCITHPSQLVALMSQSAECIGYDNINRYNLGVVQVVSPYGVLLVTTIVEVHPWTLN